ncbi:hypothetical protein LJC42_00230 [Eubacteriales bacterium OttesenSCG-928-K08]|nr:hypothetical protein [Eubacteriales bacterium OttesenSCG-928-K08]
MNILTGKEKKERLKELRGKVALIEALKREEEVLRSLSEPRPTQFREVASFGSGQVNDMVGNGATRLEEIHALINKEMCGLAESITFARNIIAEVPGERDRALLTHHYVNGLTWDETAEEVGYCSQHCRERRDYALGIKTRLHPRQRLI